MERKIYFVGEGTVNGEVMRTAKFNQVINPDTMEQVFEDVFQITECADFEKYEQKENFMATVLAMVYGALSLEGEVGEEITFTAIEEGTDIFLWGVKVNIMDEDNFQYTTLDWKSKGTLKYTDGDMVISIKQFVEELEAMKDKEFVIDCDNSQRIDFKFSVCKIATDFEEDEEGNTMGEMVFGDYSVADMAINFDVIDKVVKASDGVYVLELKDGRSSVFVTQVDACDTEKLFKETYKKLLENKVDAYAEIWYFHNPQVKELFSEDEFINLAKKSSRFICKSDGKAVSTIDYHTVKQILFKEDEEKCYAYDKIWKEFVNGMVAYMKVQVEKVLKTLNGEVM